MKHIVEQLLTNALIKLKERAYVLSDITKPFKVDHTKDTSHGDFASNIALVLSKSAGQTPRQMAILIVEALEKHPALERVEIAGPGFINFFMHANALSKIVTTVLKEKSNFGQSNIGQGKKVIVEFVSANPTGPLHVGHGRGAAFGASLVTILKTAGFDVHCEYYVNDAGRQMTILAVSVWLRYLALAGIDIVFPTNGYRGDYVIDIAQTILTNYGRVYLHAWPEISHELPLDELEGGDKDIYIDALITRANILLGVAGFNLFHKQALESVLTDIRDDLQAFGVSFDNWFSEQSLSDDESINHAIDALKDTGHTYVKAGALWFKATDFGDEKDRVLIRANKKTTYFASDVAYHWNKYSRGFKQVIDIFGADHHGYVKRVKSAVKALGHNEQAIDVLLVQFAILYRQGVRIQMSTRSGSFITLRQLREEVGNDAARFFYVMRKPEQHMDFDLDLAKSESNDNPVYYIQYAYARISSVMRQLKERGFVLNEQVGLEHIEKLTQPHELLLQTLINRYPDIINSAAKTCEPHQLAYYLRELATALHSYYNAIQLLCEQESLRNARLCLLTAVGQVLKNGLQLLGVSAPESM